MGTVGGRLVIKETQRVITPQEVANNPGAYTRLLGTEQVAIILQDLKDNGNKALNYVIQQKERTPLAQILKKYQWWVGALGFLLPLGYQLFENPKDKDFNKLG
jgi:hypothetical protein